MKVTTKTQAPRLQKLREYGAPGYYVILSSHTDSIPAGTVLVYVNSVVIYLFADSSTSVEWDSYNVVADKLMVRPFGPGDSVLLEGT